MVTDFPPKSTTPVDEIDKVLPGLMVKLPVPLIVNAPSAV